jgi:hypothetical protein
MSDEYGFNKIEEILYGDFDEKADELRKEVITILKNWRDDDENSIPTDWRDDVLIAAMSSLYVDLLRQRPRGYRKKVLSVVSAHALCRKGK